MRHDCYIYAAWTQVKLFLPSGVSRVAGLLVRLFGAHRSALDFRGIRRRGPRVLPVALAVSRMIQDVTMRNSRPTAHGITANCWPTPRRGDSLHGVCQRELDYARARPRRETTCPPEGTRRQKARPA